MRVGWWVYNWKDTLSHSITVWELKCNWNNKLQSNYFISFDEQTILEDDSLEIQCLYRLTTNPRSTQVNGQ